MKKVIIFGGGSGLSQLLKGLSQFPIDITAVVSVSDNGMSTGKLRKEFSIPAVGDITKVLMAMSTETDDVKELFNYRFDSSSSLGNHSIKNLIMTALLEMKGNFAQSLPILCDLLDVKGKILPITEDNVDLIGITKEGEEIIGEEEITKAKRKIVDLKYSDKVTANPKVIEEIRKADLIIFSSGSLITSVMPHIIIPEIKDAILKSKANKMYICNILTQPGETDNFKVSDHIKFLEKYIGKGNIDVVITNSADIDGNMEIVAKSEGKSQVIIDKEELNKMKVSLISSTICDVDGGYIRHNSLKTGYLIFSYLMSKE